ncbi:hypothetical protein [Cellulomonas marina]|uniref:ABC-2 type transport system permease protein n=1 Tax=Cellulomonas marina TaxID=988821 RepID=A0A1I0Z1U4_9CELL|nr:hypothetical protein [Cellulomonas marina]GIG28181.1 hypothetical protein Cma02nite_07810 [Cellulomonas marina]SFB19531.1 ABC-2 type transport system permease protein [Cellulomonas marina]
MLSDIAALPWLRDVSAFHWAYGSEPLRHGFTGTSPQLLLYGLALVAYVLGALGFDRRDIGT